MKMYRLYVKYPGEKRWQPVNWKNGHAVGNLIYATIFTEAEARAVLVEARKMNPLYEFELRKI
jgi:hypothetical protein